MKEYLKFFCNLSIFFSLDLCVIQFSVTEVMKKRRLKRDQLLIALRIIQLWMCAPLFESSCSYHNQVNF